MRQTPDDVLETPAAKRRDLRAGERVQQGDPAGSASRNDPPRVSVPNTRDWLAFELLNQYLSTYHARM
jgi:hypothetical protein